METIKVMPCVDMKEGRVVVFKEKGIAGYSVISQRELKLNLSTSTYANRDLISFIIPQ